MGQSFSTFNAGSPQTVLDPTGPTASADLSSSQYKIVKAGIALAEAGEGYGVLQNAPESGDQCAVAIQGLCRVKCGGTIAAHGAFKSDASGDAVAATTSGDAPLGTVLEAATDGDVVWALLSYSTAEVN